MTEQAPSPEAQAIVLKMARNYQSIQKLKKENDTLGRQLTDLQKDPAKYRTQRANVLARMKDNNAEIQRLEASLSL